jgi:hypothetical protein
MQKRIVEREGLLRLLMVLCLLGCFFSVKAQFGIKNNIPLIINADDTLRHAWAGGVNYPIWGQLDLNDDRFPDLVLFDSYDNSFIPFLNQGGEKPSYQYAAEYLKAFADCPCQFWVRFKDYDHDGDMDIFCSNNSDVSVYKNVPKNGEAYFQLEISNLEAFYFDTTAFNLLSSKVFLPDLEDVDGDGDLDFFTWPLLVNSPEIYLNIGVDSFNNADTIVYALGQTCWGHFFENGLTGLVNIKDTIGCLLGDFDPVANGCYDNSGKTDTTGKTDMEKHLGGTNLLIDMDGDKVFDLLTGDLGQPNITYLHNCGRPDYAFMDTAIYDFPSYDQPIDLFQNVSLTYFDYDGDSLRDLMVGTYDANEEYTENKNPTMWYKNIGSDDAPVFSYQRKGVITSQMEDQGRYTKPCFMDVNADGLQDLIVGNGGVFDRSDSSFSFSLMLYENVGTADRAAFKLVDDDFLGTSNNPFRFPSPTAGDVDKDGDIDLIIGKENGEIAYYENQAGQGQPASFVLRASAYQGIDAGFAASPLLYDTDQDGDLDLLVGHSLGGIAFYRNTTANPALPVYTYITDKWGFFQVRDRFGRQDLGDYAVPFLVDIDKDQEMELLLGNQAGNIQIYEGVNTALLDTLDFVGNLLDFTFGKYTAVAATVLDSTGELSYIVGTGRGGLMLANSLPNNDIDIDLTTSLEQSLDHQTWHVSIYPNPSENLFNIEISNLQRHLDGVVYNSIGKRVASLNSLRQGVNNLHLGDQPSGIYFLKLSDGQREEVVKLVKQN